MNVRRVTLRNCPTHRSHVSKPTRRHLSPVFALKSWNVRAATDSGVARKFSQGGA